MKISTKVYNQLKNYISIVPRDQALQHQSLKLGNNIEQRFRWDMLHAANKITKRTHNVNIFDILYDQEQLNDSHIDTALKKIIKELQY